MGFRFRKSIKIAPGIRLNFGTKGLNSLSLGGRGATVNVNRRGTKTTVGIPVTGLSYSTERSSADNGDASVPWRSLSGWWWLLIVAFLLYLLFR